MKVVDMHCDTISEIRYSIQDGNPQELKSNNLHIDIEKMKKGDYLLQNFAMFVNMKRPEDPLESCLHLIDIFYTEIEKNKKDIAVVRTYNDILENQRAGKLSALLAIEEGGVCKGDPAFLRDLYRLGVRMMTLTWNNENVLGYPNIVPATDDTVFPCEPIVNKGLKDKGFEIIAEMERLGIIIDVSHLSDAGFYDVYDHTTRPFVASHSNARTLCRHCRNLTDDMITKLANRGGVMGLNYCGSFLEEAPTEDECKSTVKQMAKHARYITNLGGMSCLGLGSDFDGITRNLEMDDCSKLPLLEDALRKEGFHESEIEAIFYGNVCNLYREMLK